MRSRFVRVSRLVPLLAALVLLAGCLKLDADLTIGSDDTVTGTYVVAYKKDPDKAAPALPSMAADTTAAPNAFQAFECSFLEFFSVVFLGIEGHSAAHPALPDCAKVASIGKFHLITVILALASTRPWLDKANPSNPGTTGGLTGGH